MSWTHYSKAVVLVVLLAVTLGAAGTAAAITFQEESAPDSGEVGEEVTIEITMDDLYANELPNEWDLQTDTELENPDWTVIVTDAAGEEVERQEEATDSITQTLSSDQNHVEVRIRVDGEVPDLPDSELNYENIESESIAALELSQVVEGGTSKLSDGEWTVHKYTSASQDARETLDEAREALEGVDSEDAESRFSEAKTFYNDGNFEEAKTAANEAKEMAESQSEGGLPLPLIIGAVVVLLVAVLGGFFYWRQSQQPGSKLQ